MELVFEQECPQCGGNIELAESDRLLPCPHCEVKSFLVARDYLRFVLPPQVDDGKIFYVPYLRWKGSVYNCLDARVSFKIIDLTKLAAPLNILPDTLGVRPQALKMRFADPEQNTVFLKNGLQIKETVDLAVKRSGTKLHEPINHQAFIGETISMVYLPLILREEQIFDAITNDLLAEIPGAESFLEPLIDHNTNWKPRFMATLCPDCGWDLDGEHDSIVLTCRNCSSFWEATGQGFNKLLYASAPAHKSDTEYLPFWKIQAEVEALRIESFGDFITATNQPRVAKAVSAETPTNFWIPAFKIKPKIFLRLGSQLTISQPQLDSQESYPALPIHPVNLPRNEALQSLETMLVSVAVNKRDIIQKLPRIKFTVSRTELALLPFANNGYSLYHKQTGLNINSQILRNGHHL
jgi:DNA-directed RNA polymerase subunit RPC12/RpoP